MMGRRQTLRGGDEWDVASRKARRIVPMGRGVIKQVKRRMNKRARQEARQGVRHQS